MKQLPPANDQTGIGAVKSVCTDYFAIDAALQQAFNRQERRFNAYKVAYWAQQTNVTEVNGYLLQKVGTVLSARIEFVCPNNHLTASIELGERVPSIAECHVCREEFSPTLEESNIAFSFSSKLTRCLDEKKTTLPNPVQGTRGWPSRHGSPLQQH